MTEAAGKETAESNKDSPRVRFGIPFFEGGKRVLDIGCNTGWYLDLLDCEEKWGLDCDSTFTKSVNKKGYHFVSGYSWNLGFPDESFDRVHFGQTLAHMREDLGERSLVEIYRVLVPNGIAVVSTVVGTAFMSGMMWHIDQSKIIAQQPSWFHHIEWEPPDLFMTLRTIGFRPISFTVVPQEDSGSETYKSTRFVQVFAVRKPAKDEITKWDSVKDGDEEK